MNAVGPVQYLPLGIHVEVAKNRDFLEINIWGRMRAAGNLGAGRAMLLPAVEGEGQPPHQPTFALLSCCWFSY